MCRRGLRGQASRVSRVSQRSIRAGAPKTGRASVLGCVPLNPGFTLEVVQCPEHAPLSGNRANSGVCVCVFVWGWKRYGHARTLDDVLSARLTQLSDSCSTSFRLFTRSISLSGGATAWVRQGGEGNVPVVVVGGRPASADSRARGACVWSPLEGAGDSGGLRTEGGGEGLGDLSPPPRNMLPNDTAAHTRAHAHIRITGGWRPMGWCVWTSPRVRARRVVSAQ